MAALEAKLAGRVRLERLDEATVDPVERADCERFATLARAVADSILTYRDLPTLGLFGPEIAWSVGETGRPLARSHGARYALLVRVFDAHASPELIAANVGILDAGRAPVPAVFLGIHRGAAALGDLESGLVVWRAIELSGTPSTDLRTVAGAGTVVDALLLRFPI